MTNKDAIWVLELIRDRYSALDFERWSLTDAETDAINTAIEALEEVQRHEETFEWCHDCKEYDTDSRCCHRWSKVIHESVEEIGVIQCKDCAYYYEPLEDCCSVYQAKMDCPVDFVQQDFDFCSWGERREDVRKSD